MAIKIHFVLVFILVFLLGLSLVKGVGLICEVKTDCSGAGETTVFKISKLTGGHAEIPGGVKYDNKVCCRGDGFDVGNSCVSPDKVTILKLSGTTNAHVQIPSVGTYTNDVCLSTPGGFLSICEYKSSCAAGETCLASISATDNAQVADCVTNPYSTKVCCTLVPGTTCEDDCTYAEDNTIHKECDGINGCAFFDETAKNVCDLAQPGWIRDYDGPGCTTPPCEIECAEGSPEGKIETKATVTCELENLIKLTKVVSYKGELVKLVVVTCG